VVLITAAPLGLLAALGAGCTGAPPGAAPVVGTTATSALRPPPASRSAVAATRPIPEPTGTPGPGGSAAGCAVTALRTSALPRAVPGFTDAARRPGATTWMGDDRLVAVLFYSIDGTRTMRAGGRMTADRVTKIFWYLPGGGDRLTLRGTEAASGRAFTQSIEGIGGGAFPSVPIVPAAGCWTLTASVGARTAGSITLPVIGPVGT